MNSEILAREIYNELNSLGVSLRVSGNWVVAEPPHKVPPTILMKMSQCSDELAKLVKLYSAAPASREEAEIFVKAEKFINRKKAAKHN